MGRTPGNPGKRPARTFARKIPVRVCGVRNVRKTGNVGFMRVRDMLAMCG